MEIGKSIYSFFHAIAANHRVISRHFLQPRVSGIAFLSTAFIFFLAIASEHFCSFSFAGVLSKTAN